ncbi:adenylate kinase isoenzyme 1-like [Sphaerodactylus townsendi]|uniref:adenylate kinase isoenzyme 1-like n=1 Tax=Sphaerodactylus townsendi TaxID=933632 RepID=UPI00202706AD|nr:adenylate kinase isoenzyme 1-like [Sphaerodactylus townsendi]
MGTCQGRLPQTTKPLCHEVREKLRSPVIIFVIGGPGCGKGPCCARLATKYNFYHVAVGELLREEVKKATGNSKAIKDIVLRGALVPAGYVLNLLMDNMLKTENVKGFFIDGFPREISQARLFEEVVGRLPNIVIVFDCSTETMIQRLLLRSHTGTRADDHDRIIRQRLETHYTLSEPVFTYYLQRDLLRNVLGEEPSEIIFAKCCSVVDDVLKGQSVQA